MGQRLAITVNSLGKDIATIYYQWSGYSESALREAKEVVDCLYQCEHESERELQLALIRMCEKNGGGVSGNDREYVQSLFPDKTFSEDVDRSYGLVSLSEREMELDRQWINLTVLWDDSLIKNEVFSKYDCYDEYVRWMTEECGFELDELPTLDEIPEIHYDLSEIEFENIESVADELTWQSIVRAGGYIYQLIC